MARYVHLTTPAEAAAERARVWSLAYPRSGYRDDEGDVARYVHLTTPQKPRPSGPGCGVSRIREADTEMMRATWRGRLYLIGSKGAAPGMAFGGIGYPAARAGGNECCEF